MSSKNVIIVTGGTHGIGAAIVQKLALEGKTVIFTGRDTLAGEDVQKGAPNSEFMRADMSNPDDITLVVDHAKAIGEGSISGLVNNAGTTSRLAFSETTLEEWDRVFAVNTRAVFQTIRCALPSLIQARGAVVNMGSIAGKVGEEGLATYCASKGAIISLTQALALEYGKDVRFNAICPGQIATRMMSRVMTNAPYLDALMHRIPTGRLGQPEEVANATSWLLSEQSSFINGVILSVDGGESSGYMTPQIPSEKPA
jgi:NAD(P)-dependent dehydrogenase (short-subunit alcohol dehydrogenase family)